MGSSPISLVRNSLQNWFPKVFFRKMQLNVWDIRLRDAQSVNQHLLCNIDLVTRFTCPTVGCIQKVSMPQLAHELQVGNARRNTYNILQTQNNFNKDSTHSTPAHAQQIQTKQAEIQLLG